MRIGKMIHAALNSITFQVIVASGSERYWGHRQLEEVVMTNVPNRR
jgi:hypothetical protein